MKDKTIELNRGTGRKQCQPRRDATINRTLICRRPVLILQFITLGLDIHFSWFLSSSQSFSRKSQQQKVNKDIFTLLPIEPLISSVQQVIIVLCCLVHRCQMSNSSGTVLDNFKQRNNLFGFIHLNFPTRFSLDVVSHTRVTSIYTANRRPSAHDCIEGRERMRRDIFFNSLITRFCHRGNFSKKLFLSSQRNC